MNTASGFQMFERHPSALPLSTRRPLPPRAGRDRSGARTIPRRRDAHPRGHTPGSGARRGRAAGGHRHGGGHGGRRGVASRWKRWLSDNGLSLAFFLLFALALTAQSLSGLSAYDAKRAAAHRPPVAWSQYIHTGHFLDGMFVNWQAALVQLACLTVFSRFLRQRGASHSLQRGGRSSGTARAERARRQADDQDTSTPWVYRNSLSLALAGLFTACLTAHAVFGHWADAEDRALLGQAPRPLSGYLASADFWFENSQTWEAEFGAIGLFLVLTIWLRQQGSSESKPVTSSDNETGDANE